MLSRVRRLNSYYVLKQQPCRVKPINYNNILFIYTTIIVQYLDQ